MKLCYLQCSFSSLTANQLTRLNWQFFFWRSYNIFSGKAGSVHPPSPRKTGLYAYAQNAAAWHELSAPRADCNFSAPKKSWDGWCPLITIFATPSRLPHWIVRPFCPLAMPLTERCFKRRLKTHLFGLWDHSALWHWLLVNWRYRNILTYLLTLICNIANSLCYIP